MKVAVITDNIFLYESFQKIVASKTYSEINFSYFCSPKSPLSPIVEEVKIKESIDFFIDNFQLVFSLHCKQLFPLELHSNIRCINVHPGLNPYNRGWYPQVFSILNKMPIGATIHEIDDQLDHGGIIVQEEVKASVEDTSLTLYNKVVKKEVELLDVHLKSIIDSNYQITKPNIEGNVNLKKDFNKLREINLSHVGTFKEHIDLLRSLSHGEYKNAYFFDGEDKIFLNVELEREKK